LNNYILPIHDRLLHDRGPKSDNFAVDALAASGDFFITLATQLDELTRVSDTTAHNPVLEDMIRTLIYMQRHYAIAKKRPNYRQ
jgi:hypothetical protein